MIKNLEYGTVETLDGSWAPNTGRTVELVFRTVGERTSEKAFELALKHIQPNRVHIVRNVKPFSQAVQEMLKIEHQSSHVVYVDADCLILEDMRPFLNVNDLPFVDSFVQDRFRGRINCGVHIVRIDVVRKMSETPEPKDDLGYILRPESYLRNIALRELCLNKQFKTFHILHDYLQRYTDIFSKYALRELRSQSERMRERLDIATQAWDTVPDFSIAKHAIAHAQATIPRDAHIEEVRSYIANLPKVAEEELHKMEFSQDAEISEKELANTITEVKNDIRFRNLEKVKPKVFGIGLSRTGTHSLTTGLEVLGFDILHNPIDSSTLETLVRGDAHFPLLDYFDGITDITTVPYYKILDHLYPGSRFILTVRDEHSWLKSCKRHWEKQRPDDVISMDETEKILYETRRFLRMKVYGTQEMNEEVFTQVYRTHVDEVVRHFEGRDNLLVINITKGEGFEKLAPFLGVPVPQQRFPHKNDGGKEKKPRFNLKT